MRYDAQDEAAVSSEVAEHLSDPEHAHVPISLIPTVRARLGLAETSLTSNTPLEQLLDALQDQQWERRASAARILGKLGQHPPPDPLVTALQDTHEPVRAAAARALGQLNQQASLRPLITALQDQSWLVRVAAAGALGKLGQRASLDSLVTALQDTHESVRAAAARAIGYLGQHVPLRPLITALQDQSWLVREAAAEALGMLGKQSTDPLLAALQDDHAMVRQAAAHALLRLEDAVSKEFFLAVTHEENESVQVTARHGMKALIDLALALQKEYAGVVSLSALLQSPDKTVEKAVLHHLVGKALNALDEHTTVQIESLVEDLRHEEAIVRLATWKTLFFLTESTTKMQYWVDCLTAAMSDEDDTIREEAERACEVLIDLALVLLEERSSRERARLEVILQEGEGAARERVMHMLIGQALRALEEREARMPIEEREACTSIASLIAALQDNDRRRGAAAGQVLARRARKALMGRLPTGPVVISLKRIDGPQVELQFGISIERPSKAGRQVVPWREYWTSIQTGDTNGLASARLHTDTCETRAFTRWN